MADWLGLAADLMHAAKSLQALGATPTKDSRHSWTGAAPFGIDPQVWEENLQGLLGTLAHALHTCTELEQTWPALKESRQRCQAMIESLQAFHLPVAQDYVRWMEWGSGLSLHEAPLTIAPFMRMLLAPRADLPGESPKSWIFTSATLGTDAQLSWFVRQSGLLAHQVLQVSSPFNYEQQAALYLPSDIPLPSHPGHSASVAALVARGARVLGGRTLVLTTTLRAMHAIAQGLEADLAGSGIEVLVQGQTSKQLLIQQFMRAQCAQDERAKSNLAGGSVLVASASFWEGVDVPGDALQMLVIDKLPFPVPDDPLVQARALACEKPFTELFLPDTALALKQGAGRLIRGERDRGVLVVCDGRLAAKGYGKRLLAALPSMRRLPAERQWLEELAALANARQEPRCGPSSVG
jgi:ATP-dependent DNA helicase DinG